MNRKDLLSLYEKVAVKHLSDRGVYYRVAILTAAEVGAYCKIAIGYSRLSEGRLSYCKPLHSYS